ncbi:MAG: HNH endonuclease family protein [Erysipelotrichaceae bacterium]
MPLLLLLLYRMLDGNQKELERIVLLFSDFILRYRLVGDYSGGGALQGTIRQIINKLNNQTIDFKYEDILFELSNSSTKDGEFPTNERFLERLYTKAFTPDEAKVLLSRIESYDNKDIKIPYEKLTLEHIMPQELSQKWRDNLNLDEKSGYIFHSEHLWLLGNLTLLSGKWNSSLSNKLYDTKKNEYSENQFRITRNIVEKYDEWNKESIIDRTKNLAKKAVAATIGPKERTRPHKIETRKKTPSGQYFLSDNFTTEKTKIKSLLYKEDKIECKTWYDLFGKICQISYKENKERFEEIVEKNIISKTSKNQPLLSELNLEFDPLISKRSDVLNEPKKIRDTDYYHESNISSLSSKTHSLKLIREIGLDELDFIIEIH